MPDIAMCSALCPEVGAADAFMEIFGFTRAENEEDGDMKRYTLDAHTELFSDGLRCNATMLETADGEYVRYDYVQAEIQRLQLALSQAVDSQLDLAGRLHALRAENERLVKGLKWIVDHYDPTAPEIAYHRAKDAIAPNA